MWIVTIASLLGVFTPDLLGAVGLAALTVSIFFVRAAWMAMPRLDSHAFGVALVTIVAKMIKDALSSWNVSLRTVEFALWRGWPLSLGSCQALSCY